MPYELIAVGSIAALIAGAAGFLLRRPRLLTVAFSPEGQRIEAEHVHAAIVTNTNGWFCTCGAHFHRFILREEGHDDRRCQCGAWGTEDKWQAQL